MNDCQRIAIENHCRFSFEATRSRFRFLIRKRKGNFSVVLTVNSGYE